jgi:hypothetical protein
MGRGIGKNWSCEQLTGNLQLHAWYTVSSSHHTPILTLVIMITHINCSQHVHMNVAPLRGIPRYSGHELPPTKLA